MAFTVISKSDDATPEIISCKIKPIFSPKRANINVVGHGRRACPRKESLLKSKVTPEYMSYESGERTMSGEEINEKILFSQTIEMHTNRTGESMRLTEKFLIFVMY